MTATDNNNSAANSELSRGELIEALRRDQARMRLPDGYDPLVVASAALAKVRERRQVEIHSKAATMEGLGAAFAWLPFRGFLSDLLAAAAPSGAMVVCACVGLAVVSFGTYHSPSGVAWSEALLRFAIPGSVTGIAALVVGLAVAPAIRGRGRWTVRLQQSGGALLFGLFAVAAISWFTLRGSADLQRQMEVALSTTDNQVGQFMLDVYKAKQAGAAVASCERTIGAVVFVNAPDPNQCSASMDLLPGKVVVKLGDTGGEFLWKNANYEQMRGLVLLGRVESISSKKLTLSGWDGKERDLHIDAGIPLVKSGDIVGVVTDMSGQSVTQIQSLTQ